MTTVHVHLDYNNESPAGQRLRNSWSRGPIGFDGSDVVVDARRKEGILTACYKQPPKRLGKDIGALYLSIMISDDITLTAPIRERYSQRGMEASVKRRGKKYSVVVVGADYERTLAFFNAIVSGTAQGGAGKTFKP